MVEAHQSQAHTTPGLRGGRAFYVFGALGAVLYGYDTGVIGGAMLFISDEWHTSPFQEGLITSCILVGAMIGALGGGPLADWLGRRGVILICSLIFVFGALASAASPDVSTLVLSRTFLGLAVGGASVTVPLYLAEMAPTAIRGAIATLNQALIILGVGLASLVTFLARSEQAWRVSFGLGLVPGVVLLAGILFMPETPRWLIRRGRDAEARMVLAITRPAEALDTEVAEIRQVEAASGGRSGLRTLLGIRWIRAILVVGVGLAIAQQLTGINTIVYYTPTILESLGSTETFALFFGVMNTVPNLIAVWFAARLVDRVGRRPLLLYGSVGTGSGMLALGIPQLLGAPSWLVNAGAVTGLVVFTVTFSLTWGPVLWVQLSEIFPLDVRGTAMGIATIANWVFNFSVSLTLPLLMDAWGTAAVFTMYAAFSAAIYMFVRRCVRETKGRSLEQIENDFRARAV